MSEGPTDREFDELLQSMMVKKPRKESPEKMDIDEILLSPTKETKDSKQINSKQMLSENVNSADSTNMIKCDDNMNSEGIEKELEFDDLLQSMIIEKPTNKPSEIVDFDEFLLSLMKETDDSKQMNSEQTVFKSVSSVDLTQMKELDNNLNSEIMESKRKSLQEESDYSNNTLKRIDSFECVLQEVLEKTESPIKKRKIEDKFEIDDNLLNFVCEYTEVEKPTLSSADSNIINDNLGETLKEMYKENTPPNQECNSIIKCNDYVDDLLPVNQQNDNNDVVAEQLYLLSLQQQNKKVFACRPSPMNNNVGQYQNLEALVTLLQNKVKEIQAFQRKTVLKINYGKEDNFTENLIEAIDSELEMERLEHSQRLLSQETVTFSPKFVKQSSLKCSGSSQGSQKSPDCGDDLSKALEKILSDKSLLCDPDYCEWQVPKDIIDRTVMQKILEIFTNMLDNAQKNVFPYLTLINQRDWSNVVFRDNRLVLKPANIAKKLMVNWNHKRSRRRFHSIIWILAKIVDLIAVNKTATKREIYYLMKNHFAKIVPQQVTGCINLVSSLLDAAPWDFHIYACSKGAVYGDLIISFSNGDILVCSKSGGVAIPQNVQDVTKVQTDASFVLVIEKDAVFQELVKQDILDNLGCTYIMVTGKGYSDMSTRLFIKKIWQTALIPVFILVDCDPYGIEIMLNYKFCSLTQAHLSDQLALPQIRWLGVFPSEVATMNFKTIPLGPRDRAKIEQLLTRPYIDANPHIKRELNILSQKGYKASIESTIIGNKFIKNRYFPYKLRNKEFM